MEHLAAWFIGALVGVRAEEVALGLKQVCRKHGAAVAVVIAERCAEGGDWDAGESCEGDDFAPILLELVEEVREEWGEHEIAQFRIGAVCVGDVVEETSTDDATAAPDRSDFREVEIPAFFRAHRGDEVEALGVGNDF